MDYHYKLCNNLHDFHLFFKQEIFEGGCGCSCISNNRNVLTVQDGAYLLFISDADDFEIFTGCTR